MRKGSYKKAVIAGVTGALIGLVLVACFTVGSLYFIHLPADAHQPKFTFASLLIPSVIFAGFGAFIGFIAALNKPQD